MQLSADPADWVWVRFYRARDGAKVRPGLSFGCNPLWENAPTNPVAGPQIFLVGGKNRAWTYSPHPGLDYRGEPGWFADGLPKDARQPGETGRGCGAEVWDARVCVPLAAGDDVAAIAGEGGCVEGGQAEAYSPGQLIGEGGCVEGGESGVVIPSSLAGEGGCVEGGESGAYSPSGLTGEGGCVEGGEAGSVIPSSLAGEGGCVEGGESGQAGAAGFAGEGGCVEGGEAEVSFAGGGGAVTVILDGIGPPASGLGAVGDYYADTAARILYGPKTAPSAEEHPTISDPATHSVSANETYGNRWGFATAGYILRVAYHRDGGNAATIRIGVWDDATGSLVASVDDPRAGQTGVFEVALPVPVPVAAGSSYTVSYSPVTAGGNVCWNGTAPVATNTPNVTYLSSRRALAAHTYPSNPVTFRFRIEPVFSAGVTWPTTVTQVPVSDTQTVNMNASNVGLSSDVVSGRYLGTPSFLPAAETTASTATDGVELATPQRVSFTLTGSANVLIRAGCLASNDGANADQMMVKIGTTVVEIGRCIGPLRVSMGGECMVNLPAGTYTVQTQYRVTAGVGTFSNRALSVTLV